MTSEPLRKMVNVVDAAGRPLRDRRTGEPVSVAVDMTSDEIVAFEKLRASNPMQEGR